MKTFVYIDHFKGDVQPAAWEALGLAKSFGSAIALVFGADADDVAKAALEYGADEVLLADDSALTDYRAETYASTLTALASSLSPNLILFPTTTRTREFAAMSALDLNSNVITDATAVEVNGDSVVVTRPIYEGKLFEKVTCSGTPQFITIRGRAFPKPNREEGKSGTITKVEAKTDAISTVEGYSVAAVGVSLNDAGVIVSGGRGVSNNPSLTPPGGLDDKQAEVWPCGSLLRLDSGGPPELCNHPAIYVLPVEGSPGPGNDYQLPLLTQLPSRDRELLFAERGALKVSLTPHHSRSA